jgi:site-specific recombinase XerD
MTIYEQFKTEMLNHGHSAQTVPRYVQCLVQFVWYFQRSPDTITTTELRQYLVYLAFQCKSSRNSMIKTIAALRCFYRYVLRRPEGLIKESIPSLKTTRIPPEFYTPEEMMLMLNVPGLRLKHRMMLTVLYATGMRPEEVCRLKVSDIHSWRMQIRVEQPGQDERYTLLSRELLTLLRNFWYAYRPNTWLFPSAFDASKPTNVASISRTFDRAVRLAGLSRRDGITSIRHSFAVHLLENGLSLKTLQGFLGHTWIVSTASYLYLMRRSNRPRSEQIELLRITDPSEENSK